MIAITTSSSISVKAELRWDDGVTGSEDVPVLGQREARRERWTTGGPAKADTRPESGRVSYGNKGLVEAGSGAQPISFSAASAILGPVSPCFT